MSVKCIQGIKELWKQSWKPFLIYKQSVQIVFYDFMYSTDKKKRRQSRDSNGNKKKRRYPAMNIRQRI